MTFEAYLAGQAKLIPLGRFGEPEEFGFCVGTTGIEQKCTAHEGKGCLSVIGAPL